MTTNPHCFLHKDLYTPLTAVNGLQQLKPLTKLHSTFSHCPPCVYYLRKHTLALLDNAYDVLALRVYHKRILNETLVNKPFRFVDIMMSFSSSLPSKIYYNLLLYESDFDDQLDSPAELLRYKVKPTKIKY